jgi:hypothetical protein
MYSSVSYEQIDRYQSRSRNWLLSAMKFDELSSWRKLDSLIQSSSCGLMRVLWSGGWHRGITVGREKVVVLRCMVILFAEHGQHICNVPCIDLSILCIVTPFFRLYL